MKIQLPLTKEKIKTLKAGDIVSLSGEIFTARDAAHKRLVELLNSGQPLPLPIAGATVYYAGGVFQGGVPVSAGPTTSARMDAFTPLLLRHGLLGMIGKGERSDRISVEIKNHGAVYFAAVGGAGAFYAEHILSSSLVAFGDLGSEAVYKFVIKDFPVVVAIDSEGNSLYN